MIVSDALLNLPAWQRPQLILGNFAGFGIPSPAGLHIQVNNVQLLLYVRCGLLALMSAPGAGVRCCLLALLLWGIAAALVPFDVVPRTDGPSIGYILRRLLGYLVPAGGLVDVD